MNLNYNLQISGDDFQDERHFLLGESFFIYRLVMYLRARFQVPLEGFKNEKEAMKWVERDKSKMLFNQADDLPQKKGFGTKSRKRKEFEKNAFISKSTKEIFKPIYEAIDKYPHLQLEFKFLKLIVFGENAPFINVMDAIGDNYIYYVPASQQPITEVGVYIKYSPFLSNDDLEQLKKEASITYRLLTTNKKLPLNELLKPMDEKRKRKSLSNKVEKYYLQIEEKCINRYLNKKPIQLDLFFQELADELKVNSSVIRNSYYTIQKRYNLPSVTEASNIPA